MYLSYLESSQYIYMHTHIYIYIFGMFPPFNLDISTSPCSYIEMCTYVFVCMSVFVSLFLSTYLSVYLESICLSILNLSIYLCFSVCPSVFVCVSVNVSVFSACVYMCCLRLGIPPYGFEHLAFPCVEIEIWTMCLRQVCVSVHKDPAWGKRCTSLSVYVPSSSFSTCAGWIRVRICLSVQTLLYPRKHVLSTAVSTSCVLAHNSIDR